MSKKFVYYGLGLGGRKLEARETGEAGKLKNVVVDRKRDLPPPFSVIGRGSRMLKFEI